MANRASRFDEKCGIVRYPKAQGAIVMKLGNRPLVPYELWNHDELNFQGVPDTSALTNKDVDRSGIDPDSELADLMREHWGVEDFG